MNGDSDEKDIIGINFDTVNSYEFDRLHVK